MKQLQVKKRYGLAPRPLPATGERAEALKSELYKKKLEGVKSNYKKLGKGKLATKTATPEEKKKLIERVKAEKTRLEKSRRHGLAPRPSEPVRQYQPIKETYEQEYARRRVKSGYRIQV